MISGTFAPYRTHPVALTLLATGAVLAPAVNATFPILAALVCGALALTGLTAVLAVAKTSPCNDV